MDVSDCMLDVLGVLPMEAVFTYALTKLLPMRNVKLFWLARFGLVLLVVPIRSLLPFWVRAVFGLVASFILPVALSKGPLPRRAFVGVLVNIVLFVAEILGAGLWIALTGSSTADYDACRANLPAFFFMHAMHLVVLVALMAALKTALDRFLRGEIERSVRFFVWFPTMQVALISIALVFQTFLLNETESLYYGSCILAVACLAVDALLFVSMERFGAKQIEEERAALLQRQLDGYLEQYNQVVADIEEAARIRHDARNQLQVVGMLAQEGEVQRARCQVAQILQRLRGDDGRRR